MSFFNRVTVFLTTREGASRRIVCRVIGKQGHTVITSLDLNVNLVEQTKLAESVTSDATHSVDGVTHVKVFIVEGNEFFDAIREVIFKEEGNYYISLNMNEFVTPTPDYYVNFTTVPRTPTTTVPRTPTTTVSTPTVIPAPASKKRKYVKKTKVPVLPVIASDEETEDLETEDCCILYEPINVLTDLHYKCNRCNARWCYTCGQQSHSSDCPLCRAKPNYATQNLVNNH